MKRLALLALLLPPMTSQAALPPEYQLSRDLQAIIDFIEKHPVVGRTISSIDVRTWTLHYGTDCKATFKRKKVEDGMPGPAGALVFDNSTCPVK